MRFQYVRTHWTFEFGWDWSGIMFGGGTLKIFHMKGFHLNFLIFFLLGYKHD